MSLSCNAYGGDDWGDWSWYPPEDEAPLLTKRGRRCCSCKTLIKPGQIARRIERSRPATEFEEMRGIACDEVKLPYWYFCEACGDLADSLDELGYCYELGESLSKQILEYKSEGGTI